MADVKTRAITTYLAHMDAAMASISKQIGAVAEQAKKTGEPKDYAMFELATSFRIRPVEFELPGLTIYLFFNPATCTTRLATRPSNVSQQGVESDPSKTGQEVVTEIELMIQTAIHKSGSESSEMLSDTQEEKS